MSLAGNDKAIRREKMMALALKAQINHFAHLEIKLREEIPDLRVEMDKRFETLTMQIDHFIS